MFFNRQTLTVTNSFDISEVISEINTCTNCKRQPQAGVELKRFILDFEKAFNTPPHELLKSKLFSYGIGGTTLNWINAFLCFRQQRVVVNDI